jgi:hypothetical protein
MGWLMEPVAPSSGCDGPDHPRPSPKSRAQSQTLQTLMNDIKISETGGSLWTRGLIAGNQQSGGHEAVPDMNTKRTRSAGAGDKLKRPWPRRDRNLPTGSGDPPVPPLQSHPFFAALKRLPTSG